MSPCPVYSSTTNVPTRRFLHREGTDVTPPQAVGQIGCNRPERYDARKPRRQGDVVTQLPEPSAKRLQRLSWRDAQLLVGVVLVLLGAAVGARIIASADDTVPMYAASTVIRPGDRLTERQPAAGRRPAGRPGVLLPLGARGCPRHSCIAYILDGELVPACSGGSVDRDHLARHGRGRREGGAGSQAPSSTSGSVPATPSRRRSAISTPRSPRA